ncbi:MAG: NAD(P)H-dependent glycerol-3-phosphate dehydrogenase [Alphaproteobacteria bacterium]|jgi:glycerol-3-phosphate dehydrogenase (NAD(P)+)
MKVGIIGAGAWGTALANIVAHSGNQVVLWSHNNKNEINKKRRNFRLPGVIISQEIVVTDKIIDISKTDIWLLATPTKFFKNTVKKCQSFWNKQPIIICSKGIEPKSGKLLSEVVNDIIKGSEKYIGILSGPQFAHEVALGKLTGSTIAGSANVRKLAHFALKEFYLEDSSDINGVQICGAGKNAIAILLGYLDGINAGENERALKLTLVWQEIIQFGRLFGANIKTFNMLCGIGDLFLTASSKTSRNYSAGLSIAKKEKIKGTVEGVAALKWIVKISNSNNLDLKILKDFYKSNSLFF